MTYFLWAMVAVCLFVAVISILNWEHETAIWLVLIAIGSGGVAVWNGTPEARAEREADKKAEEQQRLARETPHVIREADGCKVYAFQVNGVNKYFTRCNDNTTTDNSYTVSCGKSCRKTVDESIEVRK